MGFFQDLKEDLSQAVSELLPEEEEILDIPEKDIFAAAEESMGIEYEAPVEMTIDETVSMENALDSFLDQVAATAEEVDSTPAEVDIFASRVPVSEPVQATYSFEPTEVSDETATISRNMMINGDIISKGSVEIMGVINGNVKANGELTIAGEINGNSEAANIIATNANVVGNLMSSGSIKVGPQAVIRGNIYATSAVISGAVKGEIDVHGPVILDSTAIVMGNIKSKAVQINNGAAIEGMCSQCYAEVSPSTFFREENRI